jgi:outer membrane protein assembly factor BamB/precorrin-6B methylase 2
MMKQFGVKPCGSRMMLCHFCSIASYQDLIYVITGNGVDNTWQNVTAPEAPSVICFKKESGEVVWQDNSPGANILTGQWSSPLVIDTGKGAQVVVPQGDGWLRSFDPLIGRLLWKFDINFKTARLEYGGRGTRNDISATPVYYDNRVYVASGQHAEHGEGVARLVCIDPTKLGDISSELAVDATGQPLPDNRVQAVDPAKGQQAVPNPNSGLVWEYVKADRNGDGKFDFEEQFHRTNNNVAIKNDLLVVGDSSGLVHCVNAKTGKVQWTYDTLAAMWSSPLIVGDKIYVADEDGDIAIFGLSPDPSVAMRKSVSGNTPLAEINMGNSVYCSPIYANGTLYVASKNKLFAIKDQGAELAGYWPQWRGPHRNNVSADEDLLQEWPQGGPPLAWRTDGIGQGIASIAIASGSIYTLGSAGSHEHVLALHEGTGELRWKTAIGPAINDAPLMRWLSQRTPTVDDERLYASTAQGDLVCLQTSDGKELWRKNYPKDFGTLRRAWGFVDRPLVDGENLICTPGGTDATLAALNKRTGEVIWKCLLDPPEAGSYPALTVVETNGPRQYIAILKDSLIGVRATDGKLLWRHASSGLGAINTLTPLVANRQIILPGGRGNPEMVVLEPTYERDTISVKEISRTHINLDHFQDSTVRLEDHLYTAAYGGLPMCVEWRTGKTLWGPERTVGRGKVAITYADNRLYMLFADGTFLLADASPAGYQERGKFAVPDTLPATGATFPVIAARRMYVRANDHLFCYDVRAGADRKAAEPRLVRLDLANLSPPQVNPDRSVAQNKQPDAIFVPTPEDVVAKMLELAGVQKNDVVYDLGSGDGRIVIAAAKTFGSKAFGIELDKHLVEQSLDNVEKAGVGALVQINHADIFEQDLSRADVIALYLPPKLMDRLLPQFEKLKPGTRIVSHFFKFTDIAPDRSLRFDSRDDGDAHEIHLWTAPLHTAGR